MKKIILSLLIALFLPFGSLQAFMIMQLNVEQLTVLSEKVFVGRCVSIKPETDAEGRKIIEVTYDVSDTLKGTAQSRVSFRQLAPEFVHETFEKKGLRYSSNDFPLPSYTIGEENVIFLGAEGVEGLTSPMGAEQGQFVVKTSRTGEKRVVNGSNNQGLFPSAKKNATLKSLSLTPKEKFLLNSSKGDVPLEDLSTLVKKIAVSE